MLNRPAAAHAELQDPSTHLEVKAARRKWNPALHPRDSKGRFIETGGTVRLWGGKLARVVRALPHDRILVQDQTGPNEFNGRRHTTSAKWVSMVARPDGSAPTDNEGKVQEEDEKRQKDPRRGNGVARDDDGDPDTPNDAHDVDDRGRPIGDDDDPVGPRENDDQDEPTDGNLPVNVQALPNRSHGASRFRDVAAVRQHFLDLADQPGQKPQMAQFLRSVATDDEPLQTSHDGRLLALPDDETGRWYLTATGTGQRMTAAGDFATSAEATEFGRHLFRSTGGSAMRGGGFDFSDPDLDQTARTWRSPKGENIQATIQRARQEFDAQTPKVPASNGNGPERTVGPGDLKPGDRVKVTLSGNDIEWPASTRDQQKPGTVTVEGTVAPTYDRTKYAPLLDATLTGPDGTVMTSGDSVRIRRTPKQYTVTGHTEGFDPEKVRADRVRVGDIVAGGEFGHLITEVRRYPGGRTFTTRNLGGSHETEQFGVRSDDTMNVIPRSRRRPEDVQRDPFSRTRQHPNSYDAKRAAAGILKDWAAAEELARKQWPDGAPEQFRALAQHMQNVTDSPQGADGYHQNAEAMNGALTALHDLDTESLDQDLQRALASLETRLDDNADRFEADAQAIRENKRRKEAEVNPPQPEAPQPSAPEASNAPEAEPLKYAWDNPEDLVTLTVPAAIADHLTEEGTWPMQDPDTRKALDEAKRGKNGTYKVTAPIEVHEMLLEASEHLSGVGADAEPHEIRGYNNYAKRVGDAAEEMRQRREERDANAPTPDPAADDAPAPEAPDAESDGQDDGTVTLTPDEVNAPAAAANAAKAPSAMDDGEIRDEIVSLMEREMANGGELSGVDRTRLRVLEAEEARRAGRKPKEEPKPKPKTPAEEPGGLFDVAPEEQQRFVADPNNPEDQADDAFGTPDMFAAAEGRDTSRLRPPQSRKPADFEVGDRFVDADGRTHTVAEPPLRTPRGRVRVVDGDGGEHFLAPDKELRVLHADEEAPEVPETDAPDTSAPDADVPESTAPNADAPDNDTPADEAPAGETPADGPETEAPEAPADDAPADAEPDEAPDQVTIEHSGTGTVVRFPTPNGMVSDAEFAALRSLGFKPSRDRTKPRFFYLPSNMTLSRREDRVRRLREWMDRQNIAYQAPEGNDTEKPELSEEQLQQLEGRHWAPPGTWATTDFQPGDEVWTGRSWDTVDSIGPKNLRLQGRGSTPYDSVLARRRGGEIRTMFDEPADDGTPRPGATDPATMRDGAITAELERLNAATLPEGNDPAARSVRRQVAARKHALQTTQSERNHARRRDESGRRAMAELVRDPERIAAQKGQQVQGRDGALIGMVYQQKKGKWVYVDRDGRSPKDGRGAALTYSTRAAAINELNKLTDRRNERAGDGWKHSSWDDVQPGDTIRIPELGRTENSRGRTVTGWSEPLEVSEVRRGEMGQVLLTGRRGDDDVEIEVPRTDATFGASKPGTVPERERSDAGDGLPWQQMTPDDFGQDDRPAPAPDQNAPRPTDEFGTPDLIANGTPATDETRETSEANDAPETPEASDTPESSATPDAADSTETPAPAGATPADETGTARTTLDALPELPALPRMAGLSRHQKDDVRRIRSDYARVRESLDGILAGDPPTGDSREDLRRVREQLDYIAMRLNGDFLPDRDGALVARARLLELGQDLDRALDALPEREREPQGDGPNGGTLFHPWDIQDGELVRFDAENPADRDRSLAPYFGSFRGAGSASGEQGRTLVTYQPHRWNDDRQRWEDDAGQLTVTMPPRGLVERFTPEQWDEWRRPGQNTNRDTDDNATAPDAPIRETSPADMTEEDIETELRELQEWQNRHVSRTGEGPRIQGSAMAALSPVASRREVLHEEQRKRDIARRDQERKEKEKQERADALARADIGQRNEDGSYPVTVDGNDAGTVSQTARKWRYTNSDGDTSPDFYKSRADATAALVRNIDARQENADQRDRQEQARTEAPDGWVIGDRSDVAENDIIRVPITRRDGNGRPYPVGWRQPVRVNGVNRNDNGTMVLSVSNLDGSRSDISPVFLSHPDDTFAWGSDRTRPEPTPAWHHELRARMADIGDDIASLQRTSDGIDDQDRIQRLQDLVQRVGRGESDDLQGDLRQIRDETEWLEEQFSNPDLPFETRRRKSWATAAHRKAQRSLEYPDFQQGGTDRPDGPEGEKQRYGGDMVPASEVSLDDWVHVATADPVYNEPMHMVGRVIGVTPVLSNGQRRIEVETHLTLKGKKTARTEFTMINASDLVERLPEGNPGREDSSDLERRIESEKARHHASKVPVPEGWQAVDGSQIQPRPGDRFRIVARKGGGSGPNGGREHMNVTVERPAEREGYWRVEGQPLSFRPSDIVAIPDDAEDRNRNDNAPETDQPSTDGPDNVPETDGRASRARDLFGDGMNAVGGDSLPEMQELDERLGRADSAEDRDAELRDVADRMDALAEQYELAGPQGELAADRFRRAARVARGEQDDRDERSDEDTSSGENDDTSSGTTSEDAPENGDDEQQNEDQDDEDDRRRRDSNTDPDGDAADPDGEPEGGGAEPPEGPGGGDGPDSDGPDDDESNDDEQNVPEEEEDDDERRRRRRRRNRRGGNGGPGGGSPGGPGLPHLSLPNFPDGTGDGDGDGNGSDGPDGDTARRPRHRDVDSLRNAWRNGDGLTAEEDTPERRAHLADLAEREGLALSPDGGLAMYPEQQDDGTTVWRFAQVRNGTNLPGITLATDDPNEARELAGRFEEITDRNGDLFDWHELWGAARVTAWRDGEGHSLPQALRAVRDDYEQERAGAFDLPEDLTTLSDPELEAAYRQGLGPEDQFRVMAEMDRRDGYVDERIRAAVPDTPPTDAADEERRGRAMDEALGFGNTDVTRSAPATPGNLRRSFDRLDEERFQAAMEETGGRMLSPEAEAAGHDPREVFSHPKYTNKRALELASPELRAWIEGDESGRPGHGRLTYPQYRQRDKDRALWEEFNDWDEARRREAGYVTRGIFVKPQYYLAGPGEEEVFSGGSLTANDAWRKYASEELENWFDANGGRVTFNQWKQQRRDSDRIARHDYEEEQRQLAETGETQPEDTTPFTADDVTPAPPFNPARVESQEDAAFRFGGHDQMRDFAGRAEVRPVGNGESESVWLDGQQIGSIRNINAANPDRDPVWDARPFFGLDHDQNSRSQSRDTALANLVVRALQDGPVDPENPSDDVWDTVTVRLAGMTRELPELPESLRNDPEARARYERLSGLVDAFRDQRSPSGDLRDDLQQARDDFTWLRSAMPDTRRGGEQRDALTDLDTRSFWAGHILEGLGGDSSRERPRGDDQPQGDGDAPSPAAPAPDGPVNAPEGTPRPPAEPDPEPDPEPIGGQPAHWARVEDLVPGDMVRMDGTTRKGKPVQRAGYVYTAPERVDVTRNGRTDQMWRTWVTENPDGTGASGNVYTTLNAAAARAEAPDDVVPGSPVNAAQSTVQTGNMPDRVPTDRNGRALFPGSTVTGVRGVRSQEGTVTGATDTTVSVRWDDDAEDGVTPTSLAVTNSARPDGWTSDGRQVRPDDVVADSDGALLGPVDDINGDSVTIATAQGKITRSAEDLRVTGEVRDDVADTDPVTGIDEPTAADLKDGDVVVLDLDGDLVTVAITGTRRDGGRVTLEYADTTTGEMGEIDVDARAVFSRAQGPDGGAPDLGPDDAPARDDDLVVHPAPEPIAPVNGPTVDPELDSSDRDVIGDHATGPDDNPDAHQAAVRITADLPVTPEQASALATQLRAAADPSTPEGRAALRAADHLDRAAGGTPPPGLDRPRPSNAAQTSEGDLVAMPDERHGDQVRVFRVIDAEDGPGGMRSFLLEDEDRQWRRRIVHGAMPVWQLPEPQPEPVTPPDPDDTDTTPEAPNAPAAPAPAAPDTPSTPNEPSVPVARVKPGSLRAGDVIDAPVSRTGYQFNGHRRLTIISEPQRNGWWMQLTGMDEDGNVHDFGLHSGRAVNVYDRNRPTPALPPAGTPRDPNQVPQSHLDRINSDHARSMAARIIDEAIAGTEPPGDIHALREQIAQRLTAEALRDARQSVRRDGSAALDAAGITGRDRGDAQRRLRDTRDQAHADTVRAALRTINDLEPLPDESDEDLAARARDLLRLIPDQVAGRPSTTDDDADPDVTRAVTGHADDAVNAVLQQLQAAGMDPGDAERIVRALTQHMAGSRQTTARRIAARVAATNPDTGRQPGLLARIIAALIRMAKRLAELVRTGVRKIAEKYRSARERLARLRAFLGRMVRRVRQWPESRRLSRLHRAVNLPDADGDSLSARISHWAGLMPEPGRFGQSQRRVSVWRPTTWGQLAAGRLPDRSDRIQWAPDRTSDGGPGLSGLRHLAALRAAGSDVDQDVTRRLSTMLGDDFGDDPHATLQHMDDYVAANERRLVNLQAARSGATIPDDPDLEIEITAARAELSTSRREYDDLRARYAAAVPEAVAAALADIREMGPEGNAAIVFGRDTDPDAERAVRGVQRLVPRSWLSTPAARRLTAVDGTQGRYEPEGQRITVADLADEGLGTAGHALAQHFAQHLADLDAAQRAYWFTRTHTGRPGARRMRPSAMDRLLRRQQTQPETGDTLARSVQSMFSGDWYQDDDLRAFLLGLLATR